MRYYKNGSHAGFIIFVDDPKVPKETIKALTKKLSEAKGDGNFSNFVIQSESDKSNSVQHIPLSESSVNDNITSIKNNTVEEILVEHRMLCQLIGMVPKKGTLGSIKDAHK